MLKNYLKSALRNLVRFKAYSAINLFGLAVGMAGCMLIFLYVQNEFSFDKNNRNGSRIYRVITERKAPEGVSVDASTPPPLATALMNDFPQIAQAVRFLKFDNPIPLIGYRSKDFYEKDLYFVDASVFDVFTMPFVAGNPSTALGKPNAVVLTKETSEKYFGDTDPLGKTLMLDNSVKLEVTGVVQNPPNNSTTQYSLLVSFSTLYGWVGREFVDNWQNNMGETYVLLSKNVSMKSLGQQLPPFIQRHFGKSGSVKQILFQPLSRIHLYSGQDFGLQSSGDIDEVRLLSAVAFFILLIASINFVNLTTARSAVRSKEVTVRKVVGAGRRQLVLQFVGEGVLLSLAAFLLALVLVEMAIPFWDSVIGRNLSPDFLSRGIFWLGATAVLAFVGIVSSLYPAFLLSSFDPIRTLKEGSGKRSGRLLLRKCLVVTQFALTIILIIGTWIVYKQIDFMQTRKLGFDKSNLVVAPIREQSLRENSHLVESRLLKLPGVIEAGSAALLPGGPVGRTRFNANGVTGTMSMLWVDASFVPALGIELVAGRNFSPYFPSDSNDAFVVNEEAVRELGWKSPSDAIGKPFELIGGKKGVIIGVVKDFNFLSLKHKIGPIVLTMWPWLNYMLVRVNRDDLSSMLAGMKTIWSEQDPADPFTFTFLGDTFDTFYQPEHHLLQVAGGFTGLGILIACLGLFSLAAISAAQRTKEIGVRKVLGASVPRLILMLTGEFAVLTSIANLIAWPAGYFIMSRWLENFAYRTNVNIGVFIASSAIGLSIAIVTVGYQAIRAATANPVESLRYE